MRDENYCACKCKNHFCHSMFIWANKKRSDDSVLINFLRRRHERWEFRNHLNWWWDITAFSEMCYLSKQSAFHRFHCKTRQLEEIRPPFWFNVARPYVQLCTCHVNNTRCPKKSAKCHLNVSLFPILHLFISFPFLSDLVSITIFHKIMLTSESSLVKYDVMKYHYLCPKIIQLHMFYSLDLQMSSQKLTLTVFAPFSVSSWD